MRTRIKITSSKSYYHCMTRTVHGERWFHSREKTALRSLIWRVADFSGVRVLTYCIMSNHLHILIEIPPHSDRDKLTDDELIRRYSVLHENGVTARYGQFSTDQVEAILEAGGTPAEALREQLKLRMHDLSAFMETLKNRFTRWYNHHHKTYGTLWAGRFKSVLLEGGVETLREVAAYIDLNPVRAGLTSDPAAYAYSGLGEARRRSTAAISGLKRVMKPNTESKDDPLALSRYELFVYSRGREDTSEMNRGAIPKEVADPIIARLEGELKNRRKMSCRKPMNLSAVACHAFAYGSSAFIERMQPIIQAILGRKRLPKKMSTGSADEGLVFLNQRVGRADESA